MATTKEKSTKSEASKDLKSPATSKQEKSEAAKTLSGGSKKKSGK